MMRKLILFLSFALACASIARADGISGIQYGPVHFANLGTAPASGHGVIHRWCDDCTATSVCAGSGSGAWANGVAGAWSCLSTPTSGGFTNPMTTQGDLIQGGSSGAPARLGNVAAGRYLKSGAGGASNGWSSGSASGTGSCTNQVVTATNSDAAPTCSSLSQAQAGSAFFRSMFSATTLSTINAPTSGGPYFMQFYGANSTNFFSNDAAARIVMPYNATLKNLYCYSTGAQTTGVGYTFTVEVNGSDSSLTCPIVSGSLTTCNDTSDAPTVTAGQGVSLKVALTSTPVTSHVTCSVEVDG